MTRVRDYISFAIWFAGLGYIVLWLLGSPNHLVLPPALHAIGAAAAAQGELSNSHGQAAQPFRPARRAALRRVVA